MVLKKYIMLLLPFTVFSQGPTQSQNYVKGKEYKIATLSSLSSPSIQEASQTIIYYDGLGRPIQMIAKQQSPNGKNIILPIEYDDKGREIKKYLPYPTQDSGEEYQANAVTDILNYAPYQGQNPYNEILFEQSSLNRVLKHASPGADWMLNSGHEIALEYQSNTASGSGSVKKFRAVATWNGTTGLYDTQLYQDAYYGEGELFKNVKKNENWTAGTENTSELFTDKEGREVLRRNYDGANVLDTYYVYDQFGNLAYSIPPKAGMTFSQDILDKLCYQYKYDSRNRLVEKKIPGKQWQFVVYDKLNRVVATGPALPPFSNLVQSGWNITKYDAYDRPILTAWMSSPSNINSAQRKLKQDERNSQTSNFSESRNATTADITIAGVSFRYSNVCVPTSGYHVLTVNYYDDYEFPEAIVIPSSVEGQAVFYNNANKPLGLLTGRWIRASKTSTSYRRKLFAVLYDKEARPLRKFMRNHELGAGGYTQVDTKYDFQGKTEYTLMSHKRINSDNNILIRDSYIYSDQNRLLSHKNQINSQPAQLIASNEYDELGKIISKKIGDSEADPLQKIDYSYNVRGWLTGINDITALQQIGDPADLFALKINYNMVQNEQNYVGKALFNGNISETYWKTSTDNVLRKYGYFYDGLNRLKEAVYQKPGNAVPVPGSYNENIEYDVNGNISYLRRTGDTDGVFPVQVIDDMTYDYEINSNRLLKVTDNPSTATSGFRDGINSGNDYTYDENGNLLSDFNKGITSITYNHLNYPTKIIFGTSGSIEYLYDADGNKIEKVVNTGTSAVTTKYLDGFQYIDDVLQFFPTDEGYVSKNGSNFRYVFQYRDHLGNVRVSYSKNPTSSEIEIIEENNYYPFGLKHSGYNNSNQYQYGNSEGEKYKFNGKEYQSDLSLNVYDFGARNYDPALGRWMNLDPLAETSISISPYAFALDNPVYFIDPDGMDEYDYDMEDGDGWVETQNGKLRYDKDIHGPDDVKNPNEHYICEECVHTREDGVRMTLYDREYDEGGERNWEYGDHLGDKNDDRATVDDTDPDVDPDGSDDHGDAPDTNDLADSLLDMVDDNNRERIDLDIKFDKNSTNFDRSSSDLSDLVKALIDNPGIEIEILGNASYQKESKMTEKSKTSIDGQKGRTVGELQDLRAKVIKDHLVQGGINPSRLHSGKGEIGERKTVSIRVKR